MHKCTYIQIHLWPRCRQVASFVCWHSPTLKHCPIQLLQSQAELHTSLFSGVSLNANTKSSHEIQHFLNVKLFVFLLRTANAINEEKKRRSSARPYRQPTRRGWVWGREPKSICSACHSSGQGHVKVEGVFVFTFSHLLWRESI